MPEAVEPPQPSTLDVWAIASTPEPTTTLAALSFDAAPDRPHLFWEAALFTAMAAAIGHVGGSEHAGIISVFLTTGGLSSRLKSVTRELELKAGGRGVLQIARRSDLLQIFGGIFCVYLAWVVWLGPESRTVFDFALRASGLDAESTLASGVMKVPMAGLLGHNLLVALGAFLVSFVYRTHGVLLVMTWNASVWAASFVLLTLRAVEDSPWSAVATVLVVTLAMLPHLLLEAAAYGVAAMAGTRVGIYLFRHVRAIRSGFTLLGAALLLTALASALERTWPRFWLGMIWPEGGG